MDVTTYSVYRHVHPFILYHTRKLCQYEHCWDILYIHAMHLLVKQCRTSICYYFDCYEVVIDIHI